MHLVRNVLISMGATFVSLMGVTQGHAETPRPGQPAVAAPASAVAPTPPFRGIRYFYVPGQKRYRAVKFSTGDFFPAGFLAWAFSSGKGGDSCFNGRRAGSEYFGRVYVVRSDRSYRAVYSVDDLLLGRPTSSAPSWFKKRARQQHNGKTDYCTFGFAWPSW